MREFRDGKGYLRGTSGLLKKVLQNNADILKIYLQNLEYRWDLGDLFSWESQKYIITGFIVTVFNWGSILIMVERLHLHYLISFNVATFWAMLLSYILNKYYVFENYQKKHFYQGTKFIALQVFLWVLSNIILFLAVNLLGIHYFVVILFHAFFLFVLKYLLMKTVVFN